MVKFHNIFVHFNIEQNLACEIVSTYSVTYFFWIQTQNIHVLFSTCDYWKEKEKLPMGKYAKYLDKKFRSS